MKKRKSNKMTTVALVAAMIHTCPSSLSIVAATPYPPSTLSPHTVANAADSLQSNFHLLEKTLYDCMLELKKHYTVDDLIPSDSSWTKRERDTVRNIIDMQTLVEQMKTHSDKCQKQDVQAYVQYEMSEIQADFQEMMHSSNCTSNEDNFFIQQVELFKHKVELVKNKMTNDVLTPLEKSISLFGEKLQNVAYPLCFPVLKKQINDVKNIFEEIQREYASQLNYRKQLCKTTHALLNDYVKHVEMQQSSSCSIPKEAQTDTKQMPMKKVDAFVNLLDELDYYIVCLDKCHVHGQDVQRSWNEYKQKIKSLRSSCDTLDKAYDQFIYDKNQPSRFMLKGTTIYPDIPSNLWKSLVLAGDDFGLFVVPTKHNEPPKQTWYSKMFANLVKKTNKKHERSFGLSPDCEHVLNEAKNKHLHLESIRENIKQLLLETLQQIQVQKQNMTTHK